MRRGASFDPAASGAWRGYYLHAGSSRRHTMQLDLTFATATVRGEGTDDVGPFTIRGAFEPDGVKVWWHKQYVGAHAVWYEGVRDGPQARLVYGGWRLGARSSGGFKIWRGMHDDADLADVAREGVESDRAVLAREVLAR